ncbi:hypothetical protein CRENBAI_012393 [Crenichthys baileyi]|uniref:Uncharacterized protein n=1 Tax=Crenichthys baileyi TaxID=28760 RepID=A0AAV9RU07_9TELE
MSNFFSLTRFISVYSIGLVQPDLKVLPSGETCWSSGYCLTDCIAGTGINGQTLTESEAVVASCFPQALMVRL